MSDWDQDLNPWGAEADQGPAPPGFSNLPRASCPGNQPEPLLAADLQWEIPNISASKARDPPAKVQIHQDWHKSVFPEYTSRKGHRHNEHFDQGPERREFASQPKGEFHGNISKRNYEVVTIVHRSGPFVTNEHCSEEFHSEDIPVDPSLLQTTSVFRAAVDWAELDIPEALLAIIHKSNFLHPSRVQAHGLNLLRQDKESHVLVQAPTGSGKTLTFIVGTLAAIDILDPHPQILCTAPTNELLVQLTEQFRVFAEALGVTVSHISKTNRNSNAPVLLATPQLCINLFRTRGSQKSDLSHIRFLILDEADHLLNQDDNPEFFAHMETVIREFLPPTTRVLLFSATYEDKVLQHIGRVLERGYTEISVKKEELVLDNIKMYYIQKCSSQDKIDLLVSVLREQVPGVTVVFVNTVRFAQVLFDVLRERGYKCALLIGKNMTTDERFKTLDDFKRGFYSILITTNVLARGIDNTHVSRVINFDIPIHWSTKMVDAETYLHRIGRSGRFNRPGIAISIVSNTSEMHMLEEVKRIYGATCLIEKIESDEEMKEKVKQFAEEIALLDCEASS